MPGKRPITPSGTGGAGHTRRPHTPSALLAALLIALLASGCLGVRSIEPLPAPANPNGAAGTPASAISVMVTPTAPGDAAPTEPQAEAGGQEAGDQVAGSEPVPAAGPTASPAPGACPATPLDPNLTQATLPGPINGMPASPDGGQRLVLVGAVYDQDCRPAAGLAFNVWQTDGEGNYGPPSDSASQVNCCYLGATVVTDEQGRYLLRTVLPAHYSGQANPPPMHIHVESTGETPAGPLRAEIVFAGDPRLTNPSAYTNPPPVTLQTLTDGEGEYLIGAADMLLPGTLPAEPQGAGAGGSASGGSSGGTGSLEGDGTSGAAPGEVATRSFTLLPGESSASYQIREKFADRIEMVSPIGVTSGVEGEIRLALSAPPALEALTVTVDLTALNTGEPQRDEKNYDNWLVTRDYPSATFTASGVKNAPAAYREGEPVSFLLTGSLTIRDVTRPVEFAVTAQVAGDTLTGEAETKILMTDFGIDPPDLLGFVKVEDEVVVRVKIVAREEG